jgi:predicted ATP-dependent endonuclease of OLD family
MNVTQQEGYWSNRFRREEQIDEQLVSRLAAFYPEDKAKFDSLLKELLPQVSTWRTDLQLGRTLILYKTHSGVEHAADLFGEGMASLFRIALALHDSRRGHIVIIDEPELSLHPQAQKLLASAISKYSADRQIVVATHSPYFINWSDMQGGARCYRLSQTLDGIEIGVLEPSLIQRLNGLSTDWQKPHLLDAVAREVFFSEEVIFLEGQEDVALIRRFMEERKLGPLEFFGYGAGGFGNLLHFLDMAEDLNLPAAAIYDGQHATERDRAMRFFPHAMVELLPTPDIRDKFSDEGSGKLEKEGIFDSSGNIKPQHEKYLTDLVKAFRRFFDSKRLGRSK